MESFGEIIVTLITLALTIALIASFWKVFEKAGHPGWAAIIPFYNAYILLQIANREIWWLLLFFIPIVSFIVAIVVSIDVAKSFGKGTGFGLGLAFLPFIFYPILGFGPDRYQGAPAYR